MVKTNKKGGAKNRNFGRTYFWTPHNRVLKMSDFFLYFLYSIANSVAFVALIYAR